MKNIVQVFFLIFLLSSCTKQKVENVVEGWWSIDTIYYKNQNIKTCLGNNALLFKFNDKSELPYAKNNCEPVLIGNYYPSAEVKIFFSEIKNDTIPLRMNIKTKNKLFSGTHKIVFYKDNSNSLLKMEIFSDSLYIICRKGLFNYDKNIKLVDDLEELSWTTRRK